jgi:hypothetical protein
MWGKIFVRPAVLSLSLSLSPSLSYTTALKRTKCGVAVMLDPLSSILGQIEI